MPALTIPAEEIHEVREYPTLMPPLGDAGLVHRRNVYPTENPKLRRFTILWHTATLAEKDTIAQLYEDTSGGALSFDWTPPGEATTVVRFVEHSFTWEAVTAVEFSISITVEQV